MDESNPQQVKALAFGKKSVNGAKSKSSTLQKNKTKSMADQSKEQQEVLLKVGPFKYRMPGKKQRLILGSAVLGLNALLVVAVIVYFNSPAFRIFIYNVGR